MFHRFVIIEEALEFRYLIPEGTSWIKASERSTAEVLLPARTRWKFIKVPIEDIITRCVSERERTRVGDVGKLSENRGEAITRDGKTTGSFRFDGSPSPSRCRSTWATRYHSDDQFKVTIRRPFSCPQGTQRHRWCPDLGYPKRGLTAIIISAGYFYWWKTWLANF